MPRRMTPAARGILAIVGASTIWGLSPLYYRLLVHVPPLELLSHRTLWSLVLFGCVLAMQGRLGQVPGLLRAPRSLALVALAGAMISVNWFLFILATQIDRVTETSLGYYMFPLVAVGLGAVVLGERLSIARWISVALAAIAVTVLTVGLGVAPWISLVLAFTFGLYGLIKKRIAAGPVVSVTAEVAILAPLALGWLAAIWGGVVPGIRPAPFDLGTLVLLIMSGPLTAGPLILFSYASRRVSMATLGLVQYLNPTLQALIAALIIAEPMTRWHGIAFALIWGALAIYSVSGLREERAARMASARRGPVSTGTAKDLGEGSAKPWSIT